MDGALSARTSAASAAASTSDGDCEIEGRSAVALIRCRSSAVSPNAQNSRSAGATNRNARRRIRCCTRTGERPWHRAPDAERRYAFSTKVMDRLSFLLAFLLLPSTAVQQPIRITPGKPSETKPVYRTVKRGERRVEGLLLRVDCPPGRPVTFALKSKDLVTKYEAPRLDAVEYIAHTPDFKGPMSCGGRMPGDPVFLTWKPV